MFVSKIQSMVVAVGYLSALGFAGIAIGLIAVAAFSTNTVAMTSFAPRGFEAPSHCGNLHCIRNY